MLVYLLFAVVAVVLAVLLRVAWAQRAGMPMPEAVLLDLSTWLVAAVTFALLAGGYQLLAASDDPASEQAAQDFQASTTPVTSDGGMEPVPGETVPGSDGLTPPPEGSAPDAGDDGPPSCGPEQIVAVGIPGYELKPAAPRAVAEARATLPAPRTFAIRRIDVAGGGEFGRLMAVCSTSPADEVATILDAYERALAKNGETVTDTSFTVDRTVVQARRTSDTDSYVGAWPGNNVVYVVTNVTSANVSPFLEAAVPALSA